MENGDTCNHMWAYDFFARHWSLIDQKGAIPAERARACTVLHDGKMLLYGYQEDEVCSQVFVKGSNFLIVSAVTCPMSFCGT